MTDKEKIPNDLLNEYIDLYLASQNKTYMADELEFRFGTNKYNQITKTDFDNIIQKFKSLKFRLIKEEYTLNIINEYIDANGKKRDSNIRTTIKGLNNIQKYCRENMIYEDKLNNISFLQKLKKKRNKESRDTLPPIDFRDHQFRLNYKTERDLTPSRNNIKPEIIQLLDNWKDTKKIFRLIKRFTFSHTNRIIYPFKFDMSIVKTNRKRK